jgi:hypothetical protein
VLFRFWDARKAEQRFWLCISTDVVDVCFTNPGFDVDMTVDTDVRTLTESSRRDYGWTPACSRDR